MTPEITIINSVASSFELTTNDMVGPGRDWTQALARHIAIYLVMQKTDYSLTYLAKIFNRTPAAILHAYRRIAETKSDNLRSRVKSLEIRLNEEYKYAAR